MAEQVSCEHCRHRVPPNRPQPYSAALSGNPEVLELWRKWEMDLQEIERAERERFRLGLPFTFQPRFYSWCQWWTDEGRDRCPKDQFGRPLLVYELTARRNAAHDCQHFDATRPDS
jgi:hypothetical protein